MGEQLREGLSAGAAMERAGRLITEAIDLLDGAGAPSHIAAHLDLARHQLRLISGSREN